MKKTRLHLPKGKLEEGFKKYKGYMTKCLINPTGEQMSKIDIIR